MKSTGGFILLGLMIASANIANAELMQSPTQADAGDQTSEPIAVDGANYTVVPRKSQLTFYPCSQCHQFLPPNTQKRDLYSPHPSTLEHGGDRFWCLDCHNTDDRDYLRRIDGAVLDFDNAPELCATCHMARYRDWKGGAHGKRIGTWQDERVIAACPQCHNPHSPTIKPRAPKPPPPVRRNLARPQLSVQRDTPAWLRAGDEAADQQDSANE